MKLPCLAFLVICTALAAQAAENESKPAASKSQSSSVAQGYKNVGVAEFEKLRSDKHNVVLDVRTPGEFAAGHVPGAVNIDVNSPEFEAKMKALDPDKTYLVHCAAGTRSARACGKLSKLNFGHLYNLEGGFRAWQRAGNKAEK